MLLTALALISAQAWAGDEPRATLAIYGSHQLYDHIDSSSGFTRLPWMDHSLLGVSMSGELFDNVRVGGLLDFLGLGEAKKLRRLVLGGAVNNLEFTFETGAGPSYAPAEVLELDGFGVPVEHLDASAQPSFTRVMVTVALWPGGTLGAGWVDLRYPRVVVAENDIDETVAAWSTGTVGSSIFGLAATNSPAERLLWGDKPNGAWTTDPAAAQRTGFGVGYVALVGMSTLRWPDEVFEDLMAAGSIPVSRCRYGVSFYNDYRLTAFHARGLGARRFAVEAGVRGLWTFDSTLCPEYGPDVGYERDGLKVKPAYTNHNFLSYGPTATVLTTF